MMQHIIIAFFCASASLSAMTPSQAFTALEEGNKRFQKEKMECPNQHSAKRLGVADAQSPFAIIVACSDSRIAPEILFDQGIGSLFVIRVAGNVIGPFEMESIEFAAKHLGSSCILVMGHENCGAVDAVLQNQSNDIRYLAQLILPAALRAKAAAPKNLLKTATEFNAQNMQRFIEQSPIIKNLLSKKKIGVRSSYYNFQTGAVELL